MVKIQFSKQEKILLFILATVQFNHIVDFMILMPLGQQLMRIFSITTNQFSWLVSSYTFCAGVSGFIVSFVVDRFDRKKMLIFFFLGFCIGTFACGLAPTYGLLLLARAVTGTFGGVLNSVVMSIVSDAIPYEKRGSAMGVISTSFSLASVVGVPFALFLANLWGWHSSFLFLGSASVFIFFMILYGVPSQNSHLKHNKTKPIWDPLFHIFQTPGQVWALVFAGLLVLGQFMIIPFLSPSLVSNAGMTEGQLPLVYLVGGGLTFLTGPLVGRLADEYGKRNIFIVGLALSLVATLTITSLPVLPLTMVLVVVGLFFISVNARWVPALAMISGAATPEYRGSFMSFVGCVQQVMAASGAMISGLIVVRDPSGGLQNYHIVGIIAVTISCLAFLVSHKLIVLDRGK